jgi:uncharacterized membrane protein
MQGTVSTEQTRDAQIASRIHVIDVLRGIVMIIMVLDHVRDYWSPTPFRPEDLTQASSVLFLTRWITHFCAPVFVFLSGVSAYLSLKNKKNIGNPGLPLLKRGLWFIALELTVLAFFWQFSYQMILLQVIWVIGWCMIFLAGFIWLPRWLQVSFVIAVIAGHNLVGGVSPVTAGNFILAMLHNSPFVIPVGSSIILFTYALIPWIAVTGAGYIVGSWFVEKTEVRDRKLRILGTTLLVVFAIVRTANIYGDQFPWAVQENIFRTFLSWINITKYPPSLLFLCLTLGSALVLIPILDRLNGRAEKWISTFGKVPFFFYMLHIPLISSSAIIWTLLEFDVLTVMAFAGPNLPPGYTPSLLRAYAVWALVVVILYFPCRWFVKFKSQNKEWWTSYI